MIGGTRAELDAMPWDEFCREHREVRRRVAARNRALQRQMQLMRRG